MRITADTESRICIYRLATFTINESFAKCSEKIKVRTRGGRSNQRVRQKVNRLKSSGSG